MLYTYLLFLSQMGADVHYYHYHYHSIYKMIETPSRSASEVDY